MKKTLLRAICVIILVISLIVTHFSFLRLVKNPDEGGWRTWDAFYAQKDNSIDVLFIGSSRIFWNINPATIWEEYGIASFDLSSAAQPIEESYYALKEAFKTQSPQVVVLEVSIADHETEKLNPLSESDFLAGMKMSANKLELIAKCMEPDPVAISDVLLTLPCYHSRYDEITKDTVIAAQNRRYPVTGIAGYKGANEIFTEGSDMEMGLTFIDDPLSERYTSYLDRIVELCRENSAEILFTFAPKASGDYYLAIDDYVEANGINYLDFNRINDITGILPEDYNDFQHLNYKGEKKASIYMGQYLLDNYHVNTYDPSDPSYLSLSENLDYSKQMLNDYTLAQITGMADYFNALNGGRYLLILSLEGSYTVPDQGQKDLLKGLCITDESYALGGTWIMDGSRILYCTQGRDDKNFHMDIGNRTLSLETNEDDPDYLDVFIDNESYSLTDEDGNRLKNGMGIVVYDKLAEHVIDSVYFNADNDYGMERLDIRHVYQSWY